MKLSIRDKTFDINLVNNYVHEKYMEMVQLASELSNNADIASAMKMDDKKEAEGVLRSIEKRRYQIKDELIKTRREIIKEVIETNGYEYDADWWTRRTDPDDINDFVLSCITKDQTKGQPVKKK